MKEENQVVIDKQKEDEGLKETRKEEKHEAKDKQEINEFKGKSP